MKRVTALSRLIIIGCLSIAPAYAQDGGAPDDVSERDADAVADKVMRPSPIMQESTAESAMTTSQQGRTATTTNRANTGPGVREINGDECNPLCDMNRIGGARSQPVAPAANINQTGGQAR